MKKFKLSDSRKWTHYEAHRGRFMYAVWYRNVGIDGTPITVPVKYSADLRKISEVAKEAIFMFGGEEIHALFTYELHIIDKGIDIWVPIQESLYEPLQKELKKGDTFLACLVLIGRLEKKHLYIMNDFEATSKK